MKIAIASGKSGTGKTFVATNFFYSFLNDNRSSFLSIAMHKSLTVLHFPKLKKLK